MEDILAAWNGDHREDGSYPYLGLATDWGYDPFYQDRQEQITRFGAAYSGIRWIDQRL